MRVSDSIYLTLYNYDPYQLVYGRVGDTLILILKKADSTGRLVSL